MDCRAALYGEVGALKTPRRRPSYKAHAMPSGRRKAPERAKLFRNPPQFPRNVARAEAVVAKNKAPRN